MNNQNPVSRIMNLLMLLSAEEIYDTDNPCYEPLLTAADLADGLNIPESTVAIDLRTLFSHKELRNNLIVFSSAKNEITYEGYLTEYDDDTDDNFEAFFKTIDWNNDKFGWICNEFIMDSLFPMILDNMQNTLLISSFPDFCSDEEAPAVFTITDKSEFPDFVLRMQRNIENIIRKNEMSKQKQLITFNYSDRYGIMHKGIRIIPRKLYVNTENNRIYCITAEDGQITSYRLDFIEEESFRVRPLLNSKDYNNYDPDLLSKFDYIWAMDQDRDTPVHVKLLISNNTKNILSKIDGDTSRRKYRKLYSSEKSPDIWYYEDEVIGISAFRRWVRRFGASVKVLEPRELADQLVQNAKDVLKNYGVM